MTRRWIVSAVAAMVAGPLAAVLLVGAPFATAGPASASKAPLAIVEHASKFSADARAAIASEADAVVPKLTAAGAGYMRTGLAPELPKGTELVGAVSASTPVEVDLALVPRDPQALAQFATAVSTPGTSEFRHYITTSEFGQRYGASPSAIDAVRSAMTAAGLTANAASANGLEVKVTGTAAQFEQAFSTTLNSYRLASGRVGISNTLAPRIASSAAKYVSAVIGLNTLLQLTPLDAGPSKSVGRSALQAGRPQAVKPAVASAATVSPWSATASTYANGPTPCPAASAYAASETESEVPDTPITGDLGVNNTLYTYNAYSTAYDFDPLYRAGDLGQGVNVGIFELEANYPTDPTSFDACYGINSPVTYEEIDGGNGAASGSDTGLETALDIETISALAPDAKITVYQGNDDADTGWLDTFNAIVTADANRVVSVSYGACEQLASELVGSAPQAEITLFEEAATQGQTFSVSSGDSGAEGCRLDTDTQVAAVDDPAADPYVTGVGGTSLESPGNPPSTPPTEVVWNNGPALDSADSGGAGGGGLSTLWLMPSYQADAPTALGVINSESQGLDDLAGTICSGSAADSNPPVVESANYYCREVPDVTASADLYFGFTVYYDGAWTGVGGTSGAAPIWSALFADADSTANCQADPIGFANPALYAIAGSNRYSSDFNDITSGDNDEGVSNGGYFEALTGYDMASGLGSPIAANLVADLCPTPSTTGTPTSTTVTDTVTTPGTTQTQTVTGSTPTETDTVTTPGGTQTQTVTTPGGTQTQTVTTPGTTQTQTVTTPLQTVTTPGTTETVYEYTAGGCARYLGFAVKPHSDRLRSVKVKLYVNNKLVRIYKGHALKTVKLTHPKHSKFRVTVVSTLSNGEVVGQVLQFDGCTYYTTKWVVLQR